MSIRRLFASALGLAALGVIGSASAASLTTSGYAENFDELGTAGTTLPTDWSLWTASGSHYSWTDANGGIPATTSVRTVNGTANQTVNGVAQMTEIGTSTLTATTTPSGTNINGFNAAVSSSNTADRVIATSPTSNAGEAWQLVLTNNTGAALTGLSVSYDIDRLATGGAADELPGYELFYSINNGSSWTNVSALNPTSATVPNSLGVTNVSGNINFGATVANGGTVELRWVDDNAYTASPDEILGLNNVNVAVAPVPLPAGLPLLASALGALGLFGRRRQQNA